MRRQYIPFLLGTCMISILITTSPILAHRGRTDANGGHYYPKTGEYHYHGKSTPKQKVKPSSDPSYTQSLKQYKTYQETGKKVETVQYKTTSNPNTEMVYEGLHKVYKKNGRELICGRTWKEGGFVFVVVQGKHIAIGYPKGEIDMVKTFGQ